MPSDYDILKATDYNVRAQITAYLNEIDGRVTTIEGNAVFAAYGGINQSVPVGLPDLGIGWTTLLANNDILATPRGITQDSAQNGIIFNITGVFSVAVSFTITHTEDQGGREIEIRLYNATKAVGTESTTIGIGRNQSATNFSTTILTEIPSSELGDLWQAQIGNGDAITTVEEVSFAFSAIHVSEYGGEGTGIPSQTDAGALPPGGDIGQLLVKQSATEGDADWHDLVFDGGTSSG